MSGIEAGREKETQKEAKKGLLLIIKLTASLS